MDGQCAKTRAALDEARAALAEIARRVETYAAEFPTSAETSTLDALRVTANQAMQVIEKRVQLVKLERDILSELGAATLASARTALEGETLVTLGTKLDRARAELERAEQAWTAATEARVTAQQALAQITGDAGIASLTEQRSTLELQLQDAVQEYLELSFGHRLADAAIRRYRDTHRSGMMAATERCFCGPDARCIYPADQPARRGRGNAAGG